MPLVIKLNTYEVDARKAAGALSQTLNLNDAMKQVKPVCTLFGKSIPLYEVTDVHGVWRQKLGAAYNEEALQNGDLKPYPWYEVLFELGKKPQKTRVLGKGMFNRPSS